MATALLLTFDVGPVHRLGEGALVARLVIDEIADADFPEFITRDNIALKE